MTFNDYKAYRQIMRPLLELERDRNKPRDWSGVYCAGIIILATILLALLVRGFCLLCVTAYADCQDPNTLSPKMKKAYYELKKASQEEGGFKVSIKCN